jgi:hypothetical protein
MAPLLFGWLLCFLMASLLLSDVRRCLHLLSCPSVCWLGLPPPLVVPLAGTLASAIATCQTWSPPTNALLKQRHLCHPLFDLIVAFSCNTTSIPTGTPLKKRFTRANLALFLACMFQPKRNLFLQVTAWSVQLFLDVPAKKEPRSYFFEPRFLWIPGNCGDYCRNAQPSATDDVLAGSGIQGDVAVCWAMLLGERRPCNE